MGGGGLMLQPRRRRLDVFGPGPVSKLLPVLPPQTWMNGAPGPTYEPKRLGC